MACWSGKRPYATSSAAWRSIREHQPADGLMPYPCGCGAWHIGHDNSLGPRKRKRYFRRRRRQRW